MYGGVGRKEIGDEREREGGRGISRGGRKEGLPAECLRSRYRDW